jgi:plasmid stabilization system protein ParE
MLDIEFAKTALDEYDDCIKYVEKKFSEKRALEFVLEMNYNFDLICKNPTTFPKSNYKNIRYVVVMKPITIFYTILKKERFK